MQILVDLAAQFDRQVAFVGRGVIENSQIAKRLGYLRIPPGVQIRDSEMRSYPVAGRCLHLHRLAGRAAGGAAAHRDRRPPARQARAGRRGGVFGAGDSGQREGDRAGDEPHRRARRRHHLRGHQARPRVRPRQRGRAETDAVAGQAALLRADTWGVPPAGPARPGRRARVSREHHGGARGERRPHPFRRGRGRGSRTRCRPGGC